MRPGWGERHPAIAALLAGHAPAAIDDQVWGDDTTGPIPLRISAHTTVPDLPDEFVVSIRCLVRVGEDVVVCSTADGQSLVLPGGRRETGESWAGTARREVHEETGWLIDTASLRQLGWLHLEHLQPMPDDWPHPHPDALQAVFTASATGRDGGADTPWIDSEGEVLASRLLPLEAARAAVGERMSSAFLGLLE